MVVRHGLPEEGDPAAPLEEPAFPDAGWRLGVICNPESGENRRSGLREFRRLLEGEGRIPCREVRDPAQAASALAEFARHGINLLAVNSGDGTVQAVLSEFLRLRPASELPLLALFHGGTTNMTHRDLGLPGKPLEALRRLLAWLRRGEGQGRIVGRPVLRVDPGPAGTPHFGFFFGAAAVYRGIRFFQARIRRVGLRGNAAHLVVFGRFLWALLRRSDELLSPATVRLAADGRDLGSRPAFLLLATTLDRLILGWRPFWGPGTAPLRLTLVQAPPVWIPDALPALLRGTSDPRLTPENGYWSLRACEVEVELDGGYALDGELFPPPRGGHRIRLRSGGTVRFLRIIR